MVNYILSKSPNGLFLIFERSVQFDFTIRLNFISETKFSSRTTLRQEIEKIMKDIGYVNNH